MIRLPLAALLVASLTLVWADDDDVSPCNFKAHTAVGTVSGACASEQLPAPGFNVRWKLALTFDAETTPVARQIKPDQFCDMVRAQSSADGTDIVVLSLWGDLEVVPTENEYLDSIKETAPLYETRPNLITISQTSDSPLILEILFEEPEEYFDPVMRLPSAEWWSNYLQSFYRLGTNRPDGFSLDALKAHRRPTHPHTIPSLQKPAS